MFFWDLTDFCTKLLKADWQVNQQEGGEEFKRNTIWQMMVALLHSTGQPRTEREGNTEKRCQKTAAQQKTILMMMRPAPGLGRGWPLSTRYSSTCVKCHHTEFRSSKSNPFGVGIGSQEFGDAGLLSRGTWGRGSPLKNTFLYHLCYRAKFDNSRSNNTNIMKKRSERRKHCARAGCRFGHRPPARPPAGCHKPTDRTDYNTLRRS